MPQNQKKRQQALERKKAKRTQKKQTMQRSVTLAPSIRTLVPLAAKWPLRECLVSRDWRNEGEIIQILVARESPSGKIVAASFLVDLGCLGVKNAMTKVFDSDYDYVVELRDGMMSRQALEKADLNLAAKILRESIAYARRWGFNPNPDYAQASLLLAEADPDASDEDIPLGRDGKPFFFAGPYDDAKKILAKLEKTAGPGNFDYFAMLGDSLSPFEDFDGEIDFIEDEDEDSEEEADDEDETEYIEGDIVKQAETGSDSQSKR